MPEAPIRNITAHTENFYLIFKVLFFCVLEILTILMEKDSAIA